MKNEPNTMISLSNEDKLKISNKLKELIDIDKIGVIAFLKKYNICHRVYYTITKMLNRPCRKESLDRLMANLDISYTDFGIKTLYLANENSSDFACKLKTLLNHKNISGPRLSTILNFKKWRITQIIRRGYCEEFELHKIAKFFSKEPEYFGVRTTKRILKHVHNDCMDQIMTSRKLEYLRIINNLTVRDVANKINANYSYIDRIETEKIFCNKNIYKKLLELYNITSEEFNKIDIKKDKSKIYKEFIYFIANENYIKIGITGHSTNNSRTNYIRKSAPFHTGLLAKIPGSKRMEKKIHKHLAEYKSNGEWFHYCPVVKRFCGLFLSKIAGTDEDPIDFINHIWQECSQDMELDGLNIGDL